MAGLLRVFPHRTAPPESAVWSWWLDRGSGAVPCPTLLQGWDYTTELRLGLIVNVDLAKLFLATGLQRVEDLQVVALADCKSAQTRLSMSAPVVPDDHGGGSADLTFVVPPGTVAQSLRLTASLVLAADIAPTDRRVPTLKGSRLLDAESQTLLLEGDAGRFPTEALAFSERGLGNAPWTLMLTHDDVTDGFMGAVRLLVNTEHPVGCAVLEAESAPRYAGLMRADLLRGLVGRLAQDVVEEADYEEDSVAGVVNSMCEELLGCTLGEATRQYVSNPVDFELGLQRGIDPYRELVEK